MHKSCAQDYEMLLVYSKQWLLGETQEDSNNMVGLH